MLAPVAGTLVAEGGQNLSGGPRQRIPARALLTQAPSQTLDEPTSAPDPAHGRRLMQTLTALKGQRTILLVTHRLESVVGCDQSFALEVGRTLRSHRGSFVRWGGPAKD